MRNKQSERKKKHTYKPYTNNKFKPFSQIAGPLRSHQSLLANTKQDFNVNFSVNKFI